MSIKSYAKVNLFLKITRI